MNGTIYIATDSIPEELKTTEEFRFHHDNMLRRLEAPGFIEALCAHEAAHLVFHEMEGPIKYRLLRSSLRYNVKKQRYEGHFAAIQFDRPDVHPHEWPRWLTGTALASAAGVVVARKLFPDSDGGEQGDKEHFRKDCEDLANHYRLPPIDIDQMWDWAKGSVEQRLQNQPDLMKTILRRAEELRPLFGF